MYTKKTRRTSSLHKAPASGGLKRMFLWTRLQKKYLKYHEKEIGKNWYRKVFRCVKYVRAYLFLFLITWRSSSLGDFGHINVIIHHRDPKKATSLRKSVSFKLSTVKIRWWVWPVGELTESVTDTHTDTGKFIFCPCIGQIAVLSWFYKLLLQQLSVHAGAHGQSRSEGWRYALVSQQSVCKLSCSNQTQLRQTRSMWCFVILPTTNDFQLIFCICKIPCHVKIV